MRRPGIFLGPTTYATIKLREEHVLGIILAAQLIIPQHHGLVNDTAHVLTSQTIQSLEVQLRNFERRTTIEFTILTVPNMQGLTVEEFAEKVFKAWGIGKKDAKNGLLFVLSVGDRKMRFEVGYGLESSLPDGRTGQILRSDGVRPFLQRNDWNAGISGAVTGVITYLQNPVIPQETVVVTTPVHIPLIFVLLVVVLVIGVIVWIVVQPRKRGEEPIDWGYTDHEPYAPFPIFIEGSGSAGNIRDEPTRIEPKSSHTSSDEGRSSTSDWSSPSTPVDSGGGGFDFGGGGSSSDF